jgi:hypothetical protein
MDADTPEKAKARRHLRWLLIAMAVGVGLPLMLFCVIHLGLFR